MSRLVRHDAKGPALIQIGEQVIAVCQCGLSKNKPFCDGSHQKTRDEPDGPVFVYTEARERILLKDEFPTQTKKFTPADA